VFLTQIQDTLFRTQFSQKSMGVKSASLWRSVWFSP